MEFDFSMLSDGDFEKCLVAMWREQLRRWTDADKRERDCE